jgi:cell wall-associated NlpC family hydrolase
MARGDLVAEALQGWDGTPFHPHAKAKGAGCDCKGLLWGVAEQLGFPEADSEYALALDYSLTKRDGVPADRLREGLAKLFRQVKKLKPGDILLCNWDGKPGHIAIYAGDDRAWSALPSSGVRCRPLCVLFHKFPLDSVWRWK